MKTLIIYYSRTGTTKKVAESLSKILKCDTEQILDVRPRKGPLGYIRSGKEASLKQMGKIKPIRKDISSYDFVVVGTPVWAFNISSPVRTFLSQNKKRLKKVAFFCTMQGSGDKKSFKEMQAICAKKPTALLALTTTEVQKRGFGDKAKGFAKKLEN